MDTEAEHQKQLVAWCHDNMGLYPELKFLLSIPNDWPSDRDTALEMLARGLRPGASDLLLAYPSHGYHALWLELKLPGRRLKDHQAEWLEEQEALGYATAVCYSWQEARDILVWYLGDRAWLN
jgi:hypothetical protein